MYVEEVPNDAASTVLHVIGRNHGKPQKYFYRRFAFGTWTAWEPVKVDIEGDHLALVKWRDRLHLFWVTFSFVSKAAPLAKQNSSASTTQLVSLDFNDLTQNLSSIAPQKQVQLQLNWSEYFQGKWSDRKSSDLSRATPINVPADYTPLSSYIHVAKETDAAGNEGAVKIILDGWILQAFRLVGKNSEPTLSGTGYEWSQYYGYDYANERVDATKLDGTGAFGVDFPAVTKTQNGQITDINFVDESILQQGNDFAILVSDAPAVHLSPQSTLTDWVHAEIKALGLPFFYEDAENGVTLFVQPSLAEKTFIRWGGWVIPVANPQLNLVSDTWWSSIALQPQTPSIPQVNPGDPAPAALYQLQARPDWATDPATAIAFGATLIGQSGALKSQPVLAAPVSAGLLAPSGTKLNIITSAGLNVAGLQASSLAQSTTLNKSAVNPTLNQAGGGNA